MIDYIFEDWVGKRHTIRASELGAAFQYADENLRQGVSWSLRWVEVAHRVYKLKEL